MPDTGDLDMPLLPSAEQIRRREFATIRRGYDPDQVREYLFQVAAQVETLERELRRVPKPDRSQMSPGEALAQLAAEAQAQEAAIAKAAPPPPPAIETPTDRYEQLGRRFARVIEVADQEATRVLDEAKAEADRIMEQARGEADRIRVDAQARAEEARQEASEALVQARREADRIIGGLSERRETLVQQMHEMQNRLLAVANELESAMDDRDETISQAVAERTGPAPASTEPADPRYEDLWRRRDEPSVEIPDLEPIDLDFGEEPGKD